MSQVVPLQAVPSQTLSVQLNGQSVQLNVYEKTTGVFVDVYLGTSLVVGGALGLVGIRTVRYAYLGFSGDLAFQDSSPGATVGENPTYEMFGSRYFLVYYLPSELP